MPRLNSHISLRMRLEPKFPLLSVAFTLPAGCGEDQHNPQAMCMLRPPVPRAAPYSQPNGAFQGPCPAHLGPVEGQVGRRLEVSAGWSHVTPGSPPGAAALTEVCVALAVVARHVGAAATIPLADATLVQRVGGEQHPVTADGLQEGRWRGLLGGRQGCHRHGWTGGRSA